MEDVARDGRALEADAVIITTPTFAAATLLRDAAPKPQLRSTRLGYASVSLVRMAYDRDAISRPIDGSGFVVPAVDGRLMTACSWASSKWAHLAQEKLVLFRASAGRMADARHEAMTDEELISALHSELSEAAGIKIPPVHADVTRWRNSFPQYEVGHGPRVNRIERAIRSCQNLEIAGAELHGLGIPSCIQTASKAAQRVLDSLASE